MFQKGHQKDRKEWDFLGVPSNSILTPGIRIFPENLQLAAVKTGSQVFPVPLGPTSVAESAPHPFPRSGDRQGMRTGITLRHSLLVVCCKNPKNLLVQVPSNSLVHSLPPNHQTIQLVFQKNNKKQRTKPNQLVFLPPSKWISIPQKRENRFTPHHISPRAFSATDVLPRGVDAQGQGLPGGTRTDANQSRRVGRHELVTSVRF